MQHEGSEDIRVASPLEVDASDTRWGSPGRLRDRLRQETAALHARVERRMPLLSADLSRAAYASVLGRLLGFYEPLEERFARLPVRPPFSHRPRAALLTRDLRALGLSPLEITALPRCQQLPLLAARADVGGCLYVVEGASLGGQIVARALQERLGIDAASGSAFFVGAGAETGARWKSVLAWLEDIEGGGEAQQVVNAACATFASLDAWLGGLDG